MILGASSAALARDHLELVCSGVVTSPKDGGERIALFFHFFDARASDGESRDQRLSTIYQGRLYQGSFLNKDEKPAVPIVLKHGAKTRFKGSYTVENTAGAFTLRVAGKINEDPTAKHASVREVDQTLACVDLSI